MDDNSNWQERYGGYAPSEPVDQQTCLHKFVASPGGAAYCAKCGAVLTGSPQSPYGSAVRGTSTRRGSMRWGWLVLAGIVALAVVSVLAWKFMTKRPAPVVSAGTPQAIELSTEPVQIASTANEILYKRGDGMIIRAFASYKMNAKVIGVRAWAPYDKASTGFPIDLALTWGDVAKSDYRKYVDFRFSNEYSANQWLMFQSRSGVEPPWTSDYFLSHISNNHVCPASQNLYNALMSLKEGDEVIAEGYLANAVGGDGQLKMSTSMRRDDTDAGACEAFFVQKLQIGARIYE
ncbi:MAG: hypothetical protein ACYC99_11865 [Candidatus Geothermincolia bacterium]